MHEPEKSLRPSRRGLLALGVGAFVVVAVPFTLRRGRRRLVRRRVPLMGTLADLAVVHDDERLAYAAIDAALDELSAVDATMSRFLPTSDVGRANRKAAQAPVAVSRPTADVLAAALRWAEATDGAFDPCLGRAVGLWDVTHRKTPPPAPRVQALAGRRLYRALELDAWQGRPVVRFRDQDVALDLGGIAKGFGVDRAVAALRDHGIEDGLVNVGGDLYALGASEDGDPWRVGVRSAQDPTRLATTLTLTDMAVATSGDYEQFFRHQGEHYHHLLDPTTGSPRKTKARSLTVTAATCMTADAAATARFGSTTGDGPVHVAELS
jgi:thiamine biosynthesis lipoprotein